MSKPFKIFLSIIGFFGAIYYLWVYFTEIAPFRGEDFNKKDWINAVKYTSDKDMVKKDEECMRCKMVNDLKNNYLNKDINIQEIEEMLGKTKFSRFSKFKNCLDYYLGSNGFESWHFLICLNKNQKVKYTKVYTNSY